jgi:16S rRNA (cytidine1402-2'-O)-methyltransferase
VLYLVSTPIGNLGDITARAVDTLRSSGVVLAEDTRRARQLLTHLGIGGKRVERFDAHAHPNDVRRWTDELQAGRDVALVTDAGTPGVSDPGEVLVAAAVARGLRVVAVPGASAVLAALVSSGLAGGGRFRFAGFLPRDGSERRDALRVVAETPEPVVLFEAGRRLQRTLADLAEATPERRVCVARELTKVHEELVRGTCSELAALEREWPGEAALVLGEHRPDLRAVEIDDAALDARIDDELGRGERVRSVAERLAAWCGRPRRAVYERVVVRNQARKATGR